MCLCVCGLFGIAGQERVPVGQELVQGIISRVRESEEDSRDRPKTLLLLCVL